MSDVFCKSPRICEYILRCGRNRGSRCTNRISKKDGEGLHCYAHIKPAEPSGDNPVRDSHSESKSDSRPVVDAKESDNRGEDKPDTHTVSDSPSRGKYTQETGVSSLEAEEESFEEKYKKELEERMSRKQSLIHHLEYEVWKLKREIASLSL